MSEAAPTSHPPESERFGRYLLLECIGRGGMAEVFRAVAQGVEGFQRVFVVKRIHKDKSANPALVEMFVNEARISALLHHPNIVQVYDFGQIDGSYFISMEYLRGRDLLLLLRHLRSAGRAMPPALAAYIAREIALGLAYAHGLTAQGGRSLNIVHRDISPSNVMLMRTGGVKLLDFGIAKAGALAGDGSRGHTTQTGLVKGKLSYLSPEQVRNEPLDGRSDIFSLGVVLWECLTGKRLFYDKVDYHTMSNVLDRPVPPPSTQRPEVHIPPALDFIVVRALERQLDQRYQSAATLAEDLDHYLSEVRFNPRALPTLLDELFGAAPTDIEPPITTPPPVEAGAPGSLLVGASFPSGTLPTLASGRSSYGLLPASSVSLDSVGAIGGRARMWPYAAAVGIAAVAFVAGLLARPHASATSDERAASAPKQVSVRLESDPSGASVEDESGRPLGQTPTSIDLPRGAKPVTFVLRKEGYAPTRQTVTPDRDIAAMISLRTEAPRPGEAGASR